MKIFMPKKKIMFPLVTLIFCCVLLYSANNVFNITGLLNTKIDIIKEKEMKFMFGERNKLGDQYSENSVGYNVGNVNYQENVIEPTESTLPYDLTNQQQNYILLQNQYKNTNTSWSNFLDPAAQYRATSIELKKMIDGDSYRNKSLGFYYVFDYDYTMDALKELDPIIEKTAEAQKTPKALVAAVLFREMMFMGQEDLLDGLPVIGGKSIGICQIGLENARFNEQIVHGEESMIASKTDDEIMLMLQNPKQAVYFCAVQLRARAIKQTGNAEVNLNELDEAQIHKILEEYNQSKITNTIGPMKTKTEYAKETYKYYKLFLKYYDLEKAK